jgi:hypothetical protein
MKYDLDSIRNVCLTSKSMAEAARKLNIHINTFRRLNRKYNLIETNQPGKGIKRKVKSTDLYEIINGLHPNYGTYKLKLRLFKERIKENKCEICDISEWCNMELKCELDHINGDSRDHRLENLRILCPNCHSQTDTYRSKKRK